MGAYYIVTDLSLRAPFDFSSLHVELLQAGLHGTIQLYKGVWSADYSSSKNCCRYPAEALDHLLKIIENLREDARAHWDGCTSRRFDLGYECFDERPTSKWQVKAPLLRRLADVNGGLVITIYRNDVPVSDNE